jgi:hypothetical protein
MSSCLRVRWQVDQSASQLNEVRNSFVAKSSAGRLAATASEEGLPPDGVKDARWLRRGPCQPSALSLVQVGAFRAVVLDSVPRFCSACVRCGRIHVRTGTNILYEGRAELRSQLSPHYCILPCFASSRTSRRAARSFAVADSTQLAGSRSQLARNKSNAAIVVSLTGIRQSCACPTSSDV